MSIELELAHYGVKGMKWGTRKRHAKIAGRMAAEADIGSTSPHHGTRKIMRGVKRSIDSQWHDKQFRGHKYVDTFEKSKQKSYRHAIKDQAHTTGQAVYNKIRKTSIDGIRSAARMAAEYERKKGR